MPIILSMIVPYLGLYNAQDCAQILYLVGGVRIINRNNVFHSFPEREIKCPPCFFVYYCYNDCNYILDKPTAPTVFYVVCKTTSAVVLWRSELNGGSKQEFYVQYWRISQSSSAMLSPYITDPGVTADIQYTVNNLVPETIYMFQIIARNDLGDSLSKSVKCTTDQSMYILV